MDPTRFYTRIEIKAVDTAQRIIQGHAAAFSNTDRTGDAIQPGAFDRTLKESGGDVLVFVGHDASKLPVGEPIEIRSDTKGLYTQTRIYNTADGDALLEVAKQRLNGGKTLGMSIGYRTVKERWAGKVRQLLDVDLLEYSFLASPALAANPQATAFGVKSESGVLEAIPDALQDQVRVLVDAYVATTESKPYRVEKRGSEYCVIGPGGKTMGCHPTRAKAQAQQRALYANEGKEDSSVTVMTAEQKAALPDHAFAFIEQGGTKDDGGLTTPRAKRHFLHHDADGNVDETLLREALTEAQQSEHGEKALAHLERHAKAAGLAMLDESDDAHASEWAEGVPPTLFVLGSKLRALAEQAARECRAMDALGIDTKHNARASQAVRTGVKDLIATLSHVLSMADAIEQGEDGKARVDTFRNRLRLMELEEVV